MLILTVTQLNRYVKAILEEDKKMSDVYLRGEISNLSKPSSGHLYFTIKDEAAAVRCVMFRTHAEQIGFQLENTMTVLLKAGVSLYERDGTYQLYVRDVIPEGEGVQGTTLRQLREKLEAEGLFSSLYKKEIPIYPSIIGVVTSESGAAIGDITNVINRRCPMVKILFAPAMVQGEKAVASLIASLQELDGKCDVILFGRGGGSQEDLSAFNNENLARAVFDCRTPIISAVGHEMDTSICDMVADLRAPTPSAAAELAVPDQQELIQYLDGVSQELKNGIAIQLQGYAQHLNYLASNKALQTPLYYLERQRNRLQYSTIRLENHKTDYFKKLQEKLDFSSKTMYTRIESQQRNHRISLSAKAALLQTLNPFSILARGYSAVFKNDEPISHVSSLKSEDEVVLYFDDGKAKAVVQEVVKERLSHEEKTNI